MSNSESHLFIFEGVRAESKYADSLEQNFLGKRISVKCVYDAEIYQLYRRLKEEEFSFDVLPPKAVMLFLPSPLVCKCMTIPSVQGFGSHAIIRFLQEIGEYRDEGHHDEDSEPYGHHRLADVVQ